MCHCAWQLRNARRGMKMAVGWPRTWFVNTLRMCCIPMQVTTWPTVAGGPESLYHGIFAEVWGQSNLQAKWGAMPGRCQDYQVSHLPRKPTSSRFVLCISRCAAWFDSHAVYATWSLLPLMRHWWYAVGMHWRCGGVVDARWQWHCEGGGAVHLCEQSNLPGNRTRIRLLLLKANTHTFNLFQISSFEKARASVPKNPPNASGCALASVPSSCSCSWQASSTQSRPAATTSTQPTSVRRTRTASTQAATTTRAWGTRPMMHANRGRIESLTLNASCSAWARWVCLTTPLSVVIWISSLWCI